MVEPQTNTVVLPLGTEAVIREADANRNDLIFAHQERIHEALPDYWAACTLRLGGIEKPTRKEILDLLEPEQVALAIEIYRVSYGDELILGGDCPGCRDPLANAVNLDELAQNQNPLPDGVVGPDPVLEVRLGRTGHVVAYGYLNGHQMLAEMQRSDVSLTRVALARIRAVDGEPPRMTELGQLPGLDQRQLEEEFQRCRCGYDTRVRLRHNCGWKGVVNLLTDPTFLFPMVPRPI